MELADGSSDSPHRAPNIDGVKQLDGSTGGRARVVTAQAKDGSNGDVVLDVDPDVSEESKLQAPAGETSSGNGVIAPETAETASLLGDQKEVQVVRIAGFDPDITISDDSDEEGKAGLSLAKDEIENLLWIDGTKRHRKALEQWEKKDELFAARVDRKRSQSLSVKNEIYQLIGFYSVFQGVLLTAVAQSNLLHCNNWWGAISLSALASFVTLVGVCQKFSTVWSLEITINTEEDARHAIVQKVRRLRNLGKEFSFHKHAKDGKQKIKGRRWFLASIVAVILVVAQNFLNMVTTKIVNGTGSPFMLKEGNAGVFRDLFSLQMKGQKDSSYPISVDPNATYREYVVATANRGEKVLITSDDCADFSTITIVEDTEKTVGKEKHYKFDGTPRSSNGAADIKTKEATSEHPQDGSSGSGGSNPDKNVSFFTRLLNKFKGTKN